MSTPRRAMATAVVDGMIYAIGGNVSFFQQSPLRTVEMYDPSTDRWTDRADMPTGRFYLTASAVNGKIYAVGGFGGSRAVEEYDPSTDTWTRKADAPADRTLHSASVVDGKIYVIGGGAPSSPAQATVEMYDPATDTWAQRAPLPTARMALATSPLNGRIYAIGGRDGGFGYANALSTVEEYDPITDIWSARTPMPESRWLLSASVVDGRLFALGGAEYIVVPHPGVSTVEEYTPPSKLSEP